MTGEQMNLPFTFDVRAWSHQPIVVSWMDHALSFDHMMAGVEMMIEFYPYDNLYKFTVIP